MCSGRTADLKPEMTQRLFVSVCVCVRVRQSVFAVWLTYCDQKNVGQRWTIYKWGGESREREIEGEWDMVTMHVYVCEGV